MVIPSLVCFAISLLRYAYKFDFEYQGRAAGDTGLRELAIAHLGGDIDFPLVAHAHLLHGYNPAVDEVAQPDGERCSAPTAVKLLAVDCPSGVVGCHDAARRRVNAVVLPLRQHLIQYTLGESLHSLFLCFRRKPFLVGLRIFSFVHLFVIKFVLVFCINRFKHVFVRPVWQKEQRHWLAANAAPFYTAYKVEVGRPEVERAPIEQNRPPAFVYLPPSPAIDTPLTHAKHVPMEVYMSEAEHPVLVYDEFLIHNSMVYYSWLSLNISSFNPLCCHI